MPTSLGMTRARPFSSTSFNWLLSAIGDRRGEGKSLRDLGIAHAALGNARRAIGLYEQQ